MVYVIQAWVKGSPNIVPVAQAETRLVTLARSTADLWRKEGFRVEYYMREDKP